MSVIVIPDTWHMVDETKTRLIRQSLENATGLIEQCKEHPSDIWALRMIARALEDNIEYAQEALDDLGIPRVRDFDALWQWRKENRAPCPCQGDSLGDN